VNFFCLGDAGPGEVFIVLSKNKPAVQRGQHP
jgi:hypothetical protein